MRLFTRCTCESGKCDLKKTEVGSLVECDPSGPTITESTQALSTLSRIHILESRACMTTITTNSIASRTTNESRLDWPEFNHLAYYLTGNSSSCLWFVLQESQVHGAEVQDLTSVRDALFTCQKTNFICLYFSQTRLFIAILLAA